LQKRIIVHGHGNKGFELSEESKRRCDLALRLAEHDSIVVFCGGIFSKKQYCISVAEAMQEYFWSQLKSEQIGCDVYTERESRTTIENVKNVIQNYIPNGYWYYEELYIITSEFHKPRTWLTWFLLLNLNQLPYTFFQSRWPKLFIFFKRKLLTPKVLASWSSILTWTKNIPIEIVGLFVLLCYFLGFKWPERKFRSLARTVKK
jgi:hypothetical protein